MLFYGKTKNPLKKHDWVKGIFSGGIMSKKQEFGLRFVVGKTLLT